MLIGYTLAGIPTPIVVILVCNVLILVRILTISAVVILGFLVIYLTCQIKLYGVFTVKLVIKLKIVVQTKFQILSMLVIALNVQSIIVIVLVKNVSVRLCITVFLVVCTSDVGRKREFLLVVTV